MFHGKVKAIVTRISETNLVTQEPIKCKVHFLSGGLIEICEKDADWICFNLPDKLKIPQPNKLGYIIFTYHDLDSFEQMDLKKHKKILSKEYLRIEYDDKWANHIEKRRAKSPPYKMEYGYTYARGLRWWDFILLPIGMLILAVWKFCVEETITN